MTTDASPDGSDAARMDVQMDASDTPTDLGPMCSSGQMLCGSTCVDTQTSAANCGACSHACATGQVCVAGSCQLSCPSTQMECSGVCVATQTDNANCGSCGHACAAGEVCSMGSCSITCGGSLSTCDGTSDGGVDGGSARYCADLQTDRTNCGTCGNSCNAGFVCTAGVCVISCPAGQVACSGSCRDTNTDPMACGGCGVTCAGGPDSTPYCSAGVCGIRCNPGFGDCDGIATNGCETRLDTTANCGGCGVACSFPHAAGTCGATGCAMGACAMGFGDCNSMAADGCEVNFQSDPAHCGACGTVCAAGEACSMGTCQASCGGSLTNCSGACHDLMTDPTACGSCANACASGPNSSAFCTGGSCGLTCTAGFGNCDGMAANGCETSLDTTANCGACGLACSYPHAAATCTPSGCALGMCAANFSDCNMDATDGCETSLLNDPANCGACGNACAAGQACMSGVCSASCMTGLTNCSGSCRDVNSDPGACGSCTNACPSGPNSTAFCTTGACGLRCDTGFADCDTDGSNGCETALNTTTNCGACGVACAFANAASSCNSNACVIGACNTNFGNCNGSSIDGCEANFQSDPMNCGSCGHACGAGEACSMGVCQASCGTGLTNCSGGCHDLNTDPMTCGACTTACASGPHSTAFCTSGACGLRCDAGFGDCDGDATNGCETALDTTANCGSCGISCAYANAGATCTAGVCAMGTCSTNFRDCNGMAVDGCEVNTQADPSNCGGCGMACGAGQTCSMGSCTASCMTGLANCTGSCRNLNTDPSACGSCTNTCPSGANSTAFCSSGACGLTCGAGFGNCDGMAANGCETALDTTANCGACGTACNFAHAAAACTSGACAMGACAMNYRDCNSMAVDGCEVNVLTDPANCGACGMVCGAGQTCSNGTCTASCMTGLTNCSGSCRNLTNDPSACGSCTNVCPSGSNSTAFCAGSTCGLTCSSGFGNCDGMAGNGCETALNTTANCGACGAACNYAHAAATCGASGCAMGACAMNYRDCNGMPADGCEVNTQTDPNNCGGCNVVCAAGQACMNGSCSATCMSGLMNCSGSCRNVTNDPNACGSCTNVCPSGSNSTAFCSGSTCGLTCASGFGNCDGMAANGCETALNTIANCGVCGRTCSYANAGATCGATGCAMGTCNTNFRDCNGQPVDGCEVNTQTDANNCGACGNACGAGRTCMSGSCVASCASPLVSCSGACVNTTNDPSNCGSCMNACPTRTNAIAYCAASTCGFVCGSGFGDCDRMAPNGCETALNSLTNCGACGVACNLPHATSTCGTGTCAVSACDAGWADCNSNPVDGCEVNLTNDPTHCGTCATSCGTPANGTGVCTAGVCDVTCSSGFSNCDGAAANGCEVPAPSVPPSDGSEGAFAPSSTTMLAPGVHNFTTINIPAGVSVFTNGTGVLDLRATGDVVIAGSIGVNGAPGGNSVISTNGGNGRGGDTGNSTLMGNGANGTSAGPSAGGSGVAGGNGVGTGGVPGGPGGVYGGGTGGPGITVQHDSGGGGGGYAGGGGGAGFQSNGGNGGGTYFGAGGSGVNCAGTNGCPGGQGGQGGGSPYSGTNGGFGTRGPCSPVSAGGGGGGSIGTDAAADLAVATTFRPGSGGGGGGQGTDSCSVSGAAGGPGAGGGGGGGALRIVSPTSITVTGALFANGGPGGSAVNDGGAGGGGSGGVIYLSTPRLTVTGTVSAVGGGGGASPLGGMGGTGGLGRIRIGTITSSCRLAGTFNPPLASGCNVNSTAGQTYITNEAASCRSLVGEWLFENNDLDTSGTGNNLMPAGSPTFGTGYYGVARSLNGGSAARSSTPTALPLGMAPRTIEAWVNHGALGDADFNGIVSWGFRDCLRGQLLSMRFNGFVSSANWCNDLLQNSGPAAAAGTWHHVAYTFDGTNRALYMDGVRVANDVPAAFNTLFGSIAIGSTDDGGRNWTGLIDDVRIWNYGRPAQQVLDDATLVALYPFDGNANDATLNRRNGVASATTTGSGHIGNALRFNGSTSVVTASGFNSLGNGNAAFTIEAWVNPATATGGGNVAHVSSPMGWCTPFLGLDAMNRPAAQIFSGGSGSIGIASTTAIAAGTWTHIAQTWSPANGLRLYVNGVLVASNAAARTYSASGEINNVLWGNTSAPACSTSTVVNAAFNGGIDQARVLNRELTAFEVAAHASE